MESTANINNTNTSGIFNEIQIKLKYKSNGLTLIENTEFNNELNLEKAYNLYRENHNINDANDKHSEKVFYLVRENEKIKLDKNKRIIELGLKEGDFIEVSSEIPVNVNEDLRHNMQNSDANLNEHVRVKKTNYLLIIAIIALVAICILTTILCVILIKRKKKETNSKIDPPSPPSPPEQEDEESEPEKEKVNNNLNGTKRVYYKEELITQKRPFNKTNLLFLYKIDKRMKLVLDSDSDRLADEIDFSTIKEYMDFGLIIKEQHQELDDENSLIKNYYTGYISLLNVTINNGTDDIDVINNEELYKSINEIQSEQDNNNDIELNDNSDELTDNSDFLVDNSIYNSEKENHFRALDEEKEKDKEETESINGPENKDILFIKINFYENGDIRDIFIPNGFNDSNIDFFTDIIKLILPKLSKQLYSENITDQIEQIDKFLNENGAIDEEEEISSDSLNIDYSFDEQEISENTFNDDSENEDEMDDNINNRRRRISEKGEISEVIESTNIKEIYEPMDNDNKYYSISSNEEPTYHIKGIEENETYSNITEFDLENLESFQAKLEGSQKRKLRNYFINEKDFLFSIIEIENVTLFQPEKDSIEDLTEDEERLKAEMYNDNNEVPRNDTEYFSGKGMSFNISNINLQSSNNISLTNTINNQDFINNLFNYFNSFTYTKSDISDNSNLNLRFLKHKEETKNDFYNKNNRNEAELEIEIEHKQKRLNKQNFRYLQYDTNTYYGLKNFEKEKIIFKYNLIGLVLEGTAVSKIDVATGIIDNYFKLTLGFINYKMKFSSIQTNIHIIIKNTHQMTYNYMSLLYQSNEDLEIRNKLYSEILIDLERNVSKLLEEYYDYSGIFRDSLEELYDRVKNFSGIFFSELIELIESVYYNYTIILNRTENNEYEIIDNITQVTKSAYINYINNMSDIMIAFENETLKFLENILHELDNIETFQLDVLYDIIDVIYDGSLIFKEFIKKLFKAVDRGVTSFKYDLRDFMEEIIGELLYLTDFLSVNLNKNEILRNAIDEEARNRVTIKLKDFRNIILRIMEIINTKIIEEYEKDMSGNSENSIKSDKEDLIRQCIENINNKTDIVIAEIKKKIDLIEQYETYANNIEVINDINNKSYIELNHDMYNNILKDINKLSPDYYHKTSDLITNKNNLFNLSKDIINTINMEIKTINEYIDIYSAKFIDDNNYNFDYNLYHFSKYFSNDFLNSLYNEFKLIVKKGLQDHYIKTINYNYDLAFEYFNEVKSLINKAPSNRLLGNIFVKAYPEYKSYLQEFTYLPSSKEFLDFIENNFYNVSNYVLNYITNKIQSIKKYYFNETQRDVFYRLELINQEIDRLSSNINNYFNELKLESEIKTMILNIALNEISNLNTEKSKTLDNLYNTIYKKAEKSKVYKSNCEIVRLVIKKKRKFIRFWKPYYVYEYSCKYKASKRNNKNKIIKDLSVTKEYLRKNFSDYIDNFINKFDVYLKNYVNCSQTLYDNLYSYSNGKTNNNSNIQIILNEYQKIINNTLINNTEEILFEKINSLNLINDSRISEALKTFESNLFEINNNYYKNYYLLNKTDFLEYPEEIIFKLNQSSDNIRKNIDIIKQKINSSLIERIKHIKQSTNIFMNNFNKFHFDYIISRISKEDIFKDYFNHKFDYLNDFFNTLLNSIINQENNNFNNPFFNAGNFDQSNNILIDNYTNYLTNLVQEIDDNFTYIVCEDFIITDSVQISDDLMTDKIETICRREKFITSQNYSKYNFNVVKFRTGISNSRKFPELFNSLFDDLTYDNLIDSGKIITIDDVINNKNLMVVFNKTHTKLNEIKNEFISIIQDTFDEFSNKFIIETPELTSNYWEILDSHKDLLNYCNILYNENISEVNNNTINELNIILDQFNTSLYSSLNRTANLSDYDYYSINYTNINPIFDKYFTFITDIFDKSITRIKNLKSNNFFYSIPKIFLNEIYLERRNAIKEMIKNYSYIYEYYLLGYEYNFGNAFEIYLKKYYLNYELNKTYDYFELMQNNSDFYIEQLLKNITSIKNLTENKFNYIVDNFNTCMHTGYNYVENEYIDQIQFNNSKCLKEISDFNNEISEYLNNSNITEFEYFIENNCTIEGIIEALINNLENDTCLNITDINSTLYSEQIEQIKECQANNNYNYSYIIIQKFNDDDQIILDEFITNFTNTVNSNIIDEHYLYNYIENYFFKNTSLETNITDYRFYFEDIQDLNFYINNLREPEYKNLINDTLIEFFNTSYENNIISFVTNETINNINYLMNYKLDIFMDYFTNKLKDEGDYYLFLLDSIDEIGNSSQLAIINLFSNLPQKLNDTIYYLLEDDIFYYIDIFFRENKNIFSNNYIDFYLNDIKIYNMNIYNIEEYMREMISNRYFNKSLDNISLDLFNKIKNGIKENIKSFIFSKLNSFISACNNISNNIKYKLEGINTQNLPNDMEPLIELINNFNSLVNTQNNRFNFSVGEGPFDLLKIFIKGELEPPLQLILDKYASIEEDLLNKTQEEAAKFPDCVSDVQINLIGNKTYEIEDNTHLINSTLFEYTNILQEDIESYVNKLIHFIYIDGLNTMDSSCEKSYCGIEINSSYSFRNLEQNSLINDEVPNNNIFHNLNETKIKNNINEKINFDNKRKGASLPEYSSNMGALSEDDILYYLSNLQKTILSFNKTYFGRDYYNVNITTNKFLQKINFTLLEKLRLSFDIKLVKFSTILTENSMKKLERIILAQFYRIKEFVHNSSDIIQMNINEFINEINDTSTYMEKLSDYVHIKIIGYYKLLHSSIQKRYTMINNNRRLEHNSLEMRRIDFTQIDYMKKEFSELLNSIKEELGNQIRHYVAKQLQKVYSKINSELQKLSKKLSRSVSYKEKIGIPFSALPFFEIVISYKVSVGMGIDSYLGTVREDDLLPVLSCDVYVKAKVDLYVDTGFFIPSSSSPVRIEFVVGLGGTVGDGRAGIKLELSFMERTFELDLYFILNIFRFEFYFRIGIYIDIPLVKYKYEFDIVRYGIDGIPIVIRLPFKYNMGKSMLLQLK